MQSAIDATTTCVLFSEYVLICIRHIVGKLCCRDSSTTSKSTSETAELIADVVTDSHHETQMDALAKPGKELEEQIDWFDQWYPVAFLE